MITDLKTIAEQSKLLKGEFGLLKQKIKRMSVTTFDLLAHPVVDEVTKGIDCTQCGNCCRFQEPGVTEEEMVKLSAEKRMSLVDFKKNHVAWDKENVSFLCTKPCTFLDGNICSVYSVRPGSCADFPGLHRPGLKWRMKQVEENYSICPIVFNVVEKLKGIV